MRVVKPIRQSHVSPSHPSQRTSPSRNRSVGSYATAPRVLVPGDTFGAAGRIMSETGASHVPVVARAKLLGMLSLHDVLDGIWESAEKPIGHEFPIAPLMVSPDDDLVIAAQIMRHYHVSCLAVVAKKKLVGVLLLSTLVAVAVRRACDGKRIDQLMTRAPLVMVQVHSRLLEAKAMMRRGQVGHLPVMEGGRLTGILSDRDLLAVCRTSLESPDEILAGEVMTPRPFVATPELPASAVGEVLMREPAGAVPIAREDQLVGIATRSDFLTQFIAMESTRSTRTLGIMGS